MGDGILDESAGCLEFFTVVGFFGGEDAVFEFSWLFEVIGYAYLPRDGKRADGEDGQ
jgi:hypothetical protein